ncbi:MAG: hypothetical protein ACHQT9_03350 [Candidatus Saccharimonadales bacterium]
MGKTRRYSPDTDELTQISHRVQRREIAVINREARQHVLAQIVLPPANNVELPDESLLAEFIQDERLDFIQRIAEEAIESFSQQ